MTHDQRLDPRTDGCLGRENDSAQPQGHRCVEPLERVHEVGGLATSGVVYVADVCDLSADFGQTVSEPVESAEVITKAMRDLWDR